jgi:general L-amino acid transport system permease protein
MTTTNWQTPSPDGGNSPNPANERIPWYRDVRVIRILAQLAFVVLFVLAIYGLITNLVSNLRASNLAMDFSVYRRPFGVAVSEGISITETWTWIQNTSVIAPILWGVALLLLIALVYDLFRTYRLRRHFTTAQSIPALIAVVLALFLISNPPAQLEATLAETFATYLRPSTVARAFITGITNTLAAVVISLVACTVLGILVGIGLLSTNFLLRSVSTVYVEIFRNTPLLVQLIFIYRTLTLLLPAPRQSIFSPPQIGPLTLENNLFAFNARGFYFARLVPTETNTALGLALLAGLVITFLVRRQRLKVQEETGQPARTWRFAVSIMLASLVIGWLLAGTPYTVSYPELRGPNIQEGMVFSIAFVSLVLGLTLYTASFIADIVRAGIQSVPYGQIEAARSQGLKGNQVLSLVVLPQALRLIIPPLGNQYVNLGKNSSLALIVGFVDTYRIGQLTNNESGQAVPIFVGLMLIYLTFSLILSLMTNLLNRSTRFRTR